MCYRSRVYWTATIALLVIGSSVQGAIKPTDSRLERIQTLKATFGQRLKSPALENSARVTSLNAARPMRLGSTAAGPNSRGALVAQTWRDWASNANMGRTVAVTLPSANPLVGVAFAYTRKAGWGSPTKWGYNAWYASSGAFVSPSGEDVFGGAFPPPDPWGGAYPKVLIDPQNGKAIIGSYLIPDNVNQPTVTRLQLAFEAVAFSGNFGGSSASGSIVADSLNKSGNLADPANYTLWPALGMTVSATDTVLYLFGFEATDTSQAYGALKVYRHLSTAHAANPDLLWQLVFTDTSFFPTQDFAASQTSSRVAAVWVNHTPAGRLSGTQEDNDVYYADSPTGLSGTWTKHNLTNYSGAGYRAWLECNALFDSEDQLHIVWNAAATDGVVFLADRSCKLFHWSEHNPGTFSTIYSALFSAFDLPCVGGTNVLNVGKFSLGECDGRLYAAFSDWNDPQLEGVNVSDCAADANWLNGGNGELYVAVSKDLTGMSWDRPRNLSNSRSKGCDSSGNCADDRWASISETGIDDNLQPGTWPPSATYDPSGSYSGSSYTQVFYVTDRYPGGSILNPPQGPLTSNDMRWIRLACVPPVLQAVLTFTPQYIDFPAYTPPGVEKDTTVLLQNSGNSDLTFSSITVEEDSCHGPGCVSGWLGFSGISGSSTIPEGGTANMSLQLNKGGIAGGSFPHYLWGSIIFSYGPSPRVDTMRVHIIVAPVISNTTLDTITTAASIKLVCGVNGNAGNHYAGHVNMNFNPPVECDTGSNSRGNAGIYLGDASPVILRKVGSNPAVLSASIFDNSFDPSNTFRPLPPGPPFDARHGNPPAHTNAPKWQQYFSGTFTTVDSLLKVEKTWYAPTNSADTANFVIEKLQVWPSTPGAAVTNLAIGTAYDWDIPTDSGTSNNSGGNDATRRLVYQRGFNSLDTIVDCWNNGLRYGGSALIAVSNQLFIDSCPYMFDTLFGGYTARNDSFVYPTGGFLPEQLWSVMQSTGYYNQDGTNTWTDLHTVLTFRNVKSSSNGGWTIPAQAHDTLTVYSIMAVVRNATSAAAGLDSLKATIDKGKRWANTWVRSCNSCCRSYFGDVTGDGKVDLVDLSLLVCYLTGGGCKLPCLIAANFNGIGVVDLADLSSLVSYLTGGGFHLVRCP